MGETCIHSAILTTQLVFAFECLFTFVTRGRLRLHPPLPVPPAQTVDSIVRMVDSTIVLCPRPGQYWGGTFGLVVPLLVLIG